MKTQFNVRVALAGVFALAALALSAWLIIGRSAPAPVPDASSMGIDFRARITPEERRWLDETLPSATPDPFSDDLDAVMAALSERNRELIVMFNPPGEDRYFKARMWALTPDVATGDPREIEPFLTKLENAVRIEKDGPQIPDPDTPEGQQDMMYLVALGGLRRAVEIGAYAAEHPRIERIAALWSTGRTYAVNSGMILLQLEERGELSEEGAAALARLRERSHTHEQVVRQLAMFRSNFHEREENTH